MIRDASEALDWIHAWRIAESLQFHGAIVKHLKKLTAHRTVTYSDSRSENLILVPTTARVPLGSCSPPSICFLGLSLPHNHYMLENVADSRTFSIVTPDSDAIYPYSEHTLIGKEKRVLVAHLSFMALSGKFQFGGMLPGCESRPSLGISGPQATLSKSLSDILCRNI